MDRLCRDHSEKGQISKKFASLRLFFVLILAVFLRLIRLGTFSFWNDECHNLLVSENLYDAVVKGELIANHPPLPYILLACWRFIGMGYNEWTTRGLPLVFGVLGVIAIFWVARLFFGDRVGVIAAFLLAISPFHVLHSQDLKEYIYLPFFATLTTGFFYLGAKENKEKYWFFYGLLAGICCYTEAFAAPFLVAINLWFLAQWPIVRSRFKGWFLSNTFGALLFLPWLGIMLKRVHMYLVSAEHWWVPWPDIWSVLFFFKTIAFGYASVKPFFYLAFIVFALMVMAGVFFAFFQNRRCASLLLCWASLSVVIVFALSHVGQSIFLIRAMIPYAIPVYIFAAVGIAAIPTRSYRTIALVLFACLCSVGLYNYYARNYHLLQHPHRPGIHPPRAYKQSAEHILERLRADDLVIHASQATWLPFQWYGFSGYPHYVGGSNEPFNQMILASNPVTTTYEEYLRIWPDVMEEIVSDNQRIWFVFSEWERNYLPGNAMSVYRWLDSKFVETEHACFKGIDIFLYNAPKSTCEPEIIERDMDTGVSSVLNYASNSTPYFKFLPDDGLIEKTLEQRQGNLELRFSPQNESKEEKQVVTFILENKADYDVECDIMALQSSCLLPFDSFRRENPTENDWNYTPHWNPNPPPRDYEMGTLSGRFDQGASTVSRTVRLDKGNYRPYVFSIVPWNTPAWQMAPIVIGTDNQVLADYENMPNFNEPCWAWVRGNILALEETKSQKFEVVGKAIYGLSEVYANMGYLALIDETILPTIAQTAAVYPEWPGRVTIPPTTAKSWEKEIVHPSGRVDIWVFERNGEKAKAYHIFRLFSNNSPIEEQLL